MTWMRRSDEPSSPHSLGRPPSLRVTTSSTPTKCCAGSHGPSGEVDIYELRAKLGRVNYRLLYFFYGRTAAVLAHGLAKEDRVPDADVNRAVARKEKFRVRPDAHTHEEDLSHGEEEDT